VHNVQPCLPSTNSAEDREAAQIFGQYWNSAFPDPELTGSYSPYLESALAPLVAAGDMATIHRPVDWFGLNHYSPIYVKADTGSVIGCGFGPAPDDVPRTAIGWPIQPKAFGETLLSLTRQYRLPIYVLENGTATNDQILDNGEVHDPDRIKYLDAYIASMREAIAAGADVRGYFVWSLLDNFEWNAGYSQRFGLVRVDYSTLQRTPKTSAHWYANMIRGTSSDLMVAEKTR
jgi:beta-glucosidase